MKMNLSVVKQMLIFASLMWQLFSLMFCAYCLLGYIKFVRNWTKICQIVYYVWMPFFAIVATLVKIQN